MAIEIAVEQPIAWELDQPEGMFEALAELVERGYSGSVAAYTAPDVEGVQWKLEASRQDAPEIPPAVAFIGDRLILAAAVLRRLSAAEFAEVTA